MCKVGNFPVQHCKTHDNLLKIDRLDQEKPKSKPPRVTVDMFRISIKWKHIYTMTHDLSKAITDLLKPQVLILTW